MTPRAVLVGLPGSGKSTIGRRLAKALGVTMIDTDAAIEEKTGRTIADIFATDGEPEFRRVEEEVVRAALASHDGVLSLGGGAVTTAGVRQALAGHTVVYLEISASEGVRRTGGNTVRPLLAGGNRDEKFRALMTERVPLYRRVATVRINTNRRNPGAVVRHIVSRLEGVQAKASQTNSSQSATPGSPAPQITPSRRKRRPSWRRGPARLTPESGSDTPPTPAAMATRRPERPSKETER